MATKNKSSLKLPSYYSQPQKIGGYDVVWNKETFMHDILDNDKKVHSTKNDLQVRTWIKENGLKAAKSSSIKNRKPMKKSNKKPTAKQLAARAKFSKMAKSGELAKKRKTATKKKNRQTGSTHVAEDKLHKAKKPGKRTSATGKTYYERRANRSDVGKLLAVKSNVYPTKAQAQKFAKEKNKTARSFRYVVALYPKSKGGNGKAHIVRKVRK